VREGKGQALGINFNDATRFAILSSFHVVEFTPQAVVVTQKIEAVHGPENQAAINRLLQQAKNTAFRITLTPSGEVTRFEGSPEALAINQARLPEGLAFQVQAALDPDAWKELAGLTFFQPPKAAAWSRPLIHSWGPLGQWKGEVHYQAAPKAADLERFDYRLDLTYHAPEKGASALPFQIANADFQLRKGGGTILYDAARARVTRAEEQFHVHGLLTLSALSADTPTELDEVQTFRVTIFDRIPQAWRRLR